MSPEKLIKLGKLVNADLNLKSHRNSLITGLTIVNYHFEDSQAQPVTQYGEETDYNKLMGPYTHGTLIYMPKQPQPKGTEVGDVGGGGVGTGSSFERKHSI